MASRELPTRTQCCFLLVSSCFAASGMAPTSEVLFAFFPFLSLSAPFCSLIALSVVFPRTLFLRVTPQACGVGHGLALGLVEMLLLFLAAVSVTEWITNAI